MFENFFKKKKKYLEKESPKAKKFLFIFLIAFILLNSVLLFVPLQVFELPIAHLTLFYLTLKGMQGQIVLQEPVLISMSSGLQIIISYLCTGLMELFVLWASIIASIGISIRKRILGLVFGLIGTQIFNLIRIFITLEFILKSNIDTIVFVHDVLFRVTLLAVIAGLYAAWFYWATRE